jgi:hypothetical protein
MTIMMICKKSYTLDPSDVESRYKTCIRRVRSLQTESSKCLLPEKANSKTTHYGSQDVIIRLSDQMTMTQPVEERDF